MKTSEQNQATRSSFTNSSTNPRMRPAVDALISKLRTLNALQEPQAAATVADDIIYQQLFQKGPHPELLFSLQLKLNSYWTRALTAASMPGDRELDARERRQLESAQKSISRDDEMEKSSLPPEESFKLTQEVARAVERIISHHEYSPYLQDGVSVPICSCGKEFDFREEWIRHVRLNVWKVIKNG